MLIQCKTCNSKYRIAAEALPSQASFVRCKKCSTPIYISAEKRPSEKIIHPSSVINADAMISKTIIICNNCESTYRIDREALKNPNLKLRCSQCNAIFDNPFVPEEADNAAAPASDFETNIPLASKPDDELASATATDHHDVTEDSATSSYNAEEAYQASVAVFDEEEEDAQPEDSTQDKVPSQSRYKLFMDPRRFLSKLTNHPDSKTTDQTEVHEAVEHPDVDTEDFADQQHADVDAQREKPPIAANDGSDYDVDEQIASDEGRASSVNDDEYANYAEDDTFVEHYERELRSDTSDTGGVAEATKALEEAAEFSIEPMADAEETEFSWTNTGRPVAVSEAENPSTVPQPEPPENAKMFMAKDAAYERVWLFSTNTTIGILVALLIGASGWLVYSYMGSSYYLTQSAAAVRLDAVKTPQVYNNSTINKPITVVEGNLSNTSSEPIRWVQVRLSQAGEQLGIAYAGNVLNAQYIQQWDEASLRAYYGYLNGRDNTNIAIMPGAEIPFQIIHIGDTTIDPALLSVEVVQYSTDTERIFINTD